MKLITLFIALFLSTFVIAQTNPNIVHVHGYIKSNGTVVQPYDRTAPNNTNRDNWSTKPNINPETGKRGTIEPDPTPTSNSIHYSPINNVITDKGEKGHSLAWYKTHSH
jgi:hypothetical protein